MPGQRFFDKVLEYLANDRERKMIKECCFNRGELKEVFDTSPLDDPWFWPNDEQPPTREPNELEAFWR